MIGREGSRRVVLAADAAAQRAGLHTGMPVTKAQALVPGLTVLDADPAGDRDALERLALWALQRYAPIAAADLPDGIVIDTTGADHLHGGEVRILEAMLERFAASGIAGRAAVAESWGAAHAHARFGAHDLVIVEPGATEDAMRAMPLHALRLDAGLVRGLRVLGFERVGDLMDQPRAPLTLRFGPELGRRLDQALARQAEPIDPIRLPELVSGRRVFAEPIAAAETIARYIGKLAVSVCSDLEERGLGARRIDLILQRVDNSVQVVRVGTALPACDVKRLTRLLTDKIPTINPGFGIEIMSLVAVQAEPLERKQMASSLIEEFAADVTSLIDILANRVGEKRLYRFAAQASDVPERMVARVPPTAPASEALWPESWPRPMRLLTRPEVIETVALLPDHPPVTFTWRGTRRRVKRADGPERVFGEWWRRDAELIAVRDYFHVEDENGERYWIFRAGDGEHAESGSQRWFMHGLFA